MGRSGRAVQTAPVWFVSCCPRCRIDRHVGLAACAIEMRAPGLCGPRSRVPLDTRDLGRIGLTCSGLSPDREGPSRVPGPQARNSQSLDAPLLRRAAAVVRDRRMIDDRADSQASRLQRSDRRLAPRAWAPHEDVHRSHPMLHRLASGRVSSKTSRVRRALARALEAGCARARPAQSVALRVRDGHQCVVET
jgi:hypothetical protein